MKKFLQTLKLNPEQIDFNDTMEIIGHYYEFEPTAFKNGSVMNPAGENNGSCKIFAFAQWHGLTEALTLQCFGNYYRKDVLGNPHGDSHQNIRNFMQTGWSAISFDKPPLTLKNIINS